MNIRIHSHRFVVAALLLMLAACGGGGDDSAPAPPPAPPPPGTLVGAAGGTVTGPSGAQVVIPAGALTSEVRINIEQITTGAPALPAGFVAHGQMFAFTPHGTTFAVPVTMTLPFDPASVPAGRTPVFYKTINAQTQWEQIANATFGATSASAQVSSFSDATVATEPFTEGAVGREWTFNVVHDFAGRPFFLQGDTVSGGLLSEFVDFGGASFDAEFALIDGRTFLPDGRANGAVGASEDGTTLYVGAEAMAQDASIPGVPIGSESLLVQVHTFTKRLDTASLTISMPQAVIDAHDENAVLHRLCPENRLLLQSCLLINGLISFDLQAFKARREGGPQLNPGDQFFQLSGAVELFGIADSWNFSVSTIGSTRFPVWTREDFQFVVRSLNNAAGSHALLTQVRSPLHVVDLSLIEVGQTFHVRLTAKASTYNEIAGPPSEFPTSIGAYMRGSLKLGGAVLEFSGLDVIDTPIPLPQSPAEDQVYVVPASCTGGANPAAGAIQFESTNYAIFENGSPSTISVTRTGGSVGAVTATFTTSDGTAVAPADYAAVKSSVFFADGDTSSRVVRVPIAQNEIGGEPDRTVNLTLSEPGGCVTLGTQSTALLTIRDDDPPPPPPSGLDPNFGSEGKATTTAFGGDRSAMAVQPNGKIVMVGGTSADFILARFDGDGSPDESFDADGQVTTDMVSGEQEEALGVAIQPDGKIVVVGYTGTAGPGGPSNIALARYDANGVLDASFGTAGKVTSGVLGRAFAVAIQGDGPDLKIVVAGDNPVTEDFLLARFNANGSLDTSFGTSGQRTTDIANGAELAGNLVLQPNGAILISGPHTNAGEVTRDQHTALARYDQNGVPDSSFGAGGELVLTNTRVGEGLALQGDGRIVLVGNSGAGVNTSFALMRLEPNGDPDDEFGDAGTVSTPISGLGDAALAVALQGDGRIVVAGRSSSQTNSNFAVARYSDAGVLDASFGNDGTLTIDFFGFTDIAESVAVQTDGKIVLGGLARDNVDGYGVARVLP